MSLKLYFHPLSSFCHKVLIALYEHDTAFEPVVVNFADERSRTDFAAVWPMAKMPVLVDEGRGHVVAESTTIVEYLDVFYPGQAPLVPADPDRAWQVRMWDRVFDNYLELPVQKIVGNALRPSGTGSDALGVEQAQAQIRQAYRLLEDRLITTAWAIGPGFTLADCAAAPALFYANTVVPFGATDKKLAAYLDRLMARPSYARILKEAEPFFSMFPLDPKPRLK
jgi:glutathione S-transferase